MEKKELNEKEMEKVSGGLSYSSTDNYIHCSSCGYRHLDRSKFSPEPFDEGCSRMNHYTCPECGYKWDA